jgi:hypothetical protein
MTITVSQRSYTLVMTNGGGYRWPLNSEEAQRLVDGPVVAASANCVRLIAGAKLIPATLGGGPAFEVVR